MMQRLLDLPGRVRNRWKRRGVHRAHAELARKYAGFTMIPQHLFIANLQVAWDWRNVDGCVVECGVWRGGMSAAMAELLGKDRAYFLLDSFEGLPPAKEIDGDAAMTWQADSLSPSYYDNCAAPIDFADRAMTMAGARRYELIKGWFETTAPLFSPPSPIAILRLDGDWYESTMCCLTNLAPKLAPGGIIIVDDYRQWDGCSRAVHDYLSRNNSVFRITEPHGVTVLRQGRG